MVEHRSEEVVQVVQVILIVVPVPALHHGVDVSLVLAQVHAFVLVSDVVGERVESDAEEGGHQHLGYPNDEFLAVEDPVPLANEVDLELAFRGNFDRRNVPAAYVFLL